MRIPLAPPRYVTQVVAGGVAIHGLALAVPVFMMQLYDRFLPNSSVASLVWFAVGTLLAIVFETLLKIVRNHWAAWHVERTIFNSRRVLMEAILSTPVAHPQVREVFPALRTVLTDSYRHFSFFLADIPFGVLYYTFIFLIHPLLCLYLLLVGAAGLFVLHQSRPEQAHVKEQASRLKEERQALVAATFRSSVELKALGAEEQVARHHAALDARVAENEARSAALETRRMLLSKALDALSVFGPIILGGVFVIRGELTLGALTASVLLARRALALLHQWGERWYSEVEIRAARKTVDEVTGRSVLRVRVSAPRLELPDYGPGDLEIRDLVLRRGIDADEGAALALAHAPLEVSGDDKPVLRVESLTVPKGSLLAFPPDLGGPISEFFEALRGLYPHYSGEIVLGGENLSRYSRTAIGRKIVLLTDRDQPFPGTFLENLASFDPNLMARAQSAAATLGLDGPFERLDRGYETVVTDSVLAGLSPSVLQRLALARALALEPRVLLLDHFDAVLDHESRRLCAAALASLRSKMTVFYRGSDPAYWDRADRRGELVDGVLVLKEMKR